MDLESLKSQVSNLTLYDLKAGVRKVQNGKTRIILVLDAQITNLWAAVMNLTEMEAMVREATNADPWGAPSKIRLLSADRDRRLIVCRFPDATDRSRNT